MINTKQKTNGIFNKKDALKQFGKRIRALRLEKTLSNGEKFSQERLSKVSGLHRNYISDTERGTRNISLVAIIKIVKALDCSLNDFFNEDFDLI